MSSIWTELLGAQCRYVGSEHRTRIIDAGEGNPPLLLLHGGGGHAEAWARNVLPLSKHFHVIAMDLLWHGLSATPPYGKPFETWSAQVVEVLDSLGYSSSHIEGESLGGWVAMWTALHHPDRVDKVILNTTAGVRYADPNLGKKVVEGRQGLATKSTRAIDDPTPETIRTRLEWLMHDPADVTDELVDIRRRIYSNPDTNRALKDVFANQFGQGHGPDYELTEEQVSRMKAPTLVLWSEFNPSKGPEVGERLASLIPGAQYQLMANVAHWPQWEDPEAHDRLVVDFLLDEQ
jgi:pimeloyl-ACP methyl ester carboxylesterase